MGSQDTLAEAYRLNPRVQGKVKRATGYGIFSNRGAKNRYYMRMAEVGARLVLCQPEFDGYLYPSLLIFMADNICQHKTDRALGVGIKDLWAVFVFQN